MIWSRFISNQKTGKDPLPPVTYVPVESNGKLPFFVARNFVHVISAGID